MWRKLWEFTSHPRSKYLFVEARGTRRELLGYPVKIPNQDCADGRPEEVVDPRESEGVVTIAGCPPAARGETRAGRSLSTTIIIK